MNKKIATLAALLIALATTSSASTVSVADITIPQGGTGDIQVCLDNDIELTAFELYVSLPDGISMTGWQADKSRLTDHLVHVTNDANELMATAFSADNTAIAGNSGALMTITLKADESLAPGTVLTATLHDMVFSTYNMVEVNPATAAFNITIGEQGTGTVSVADITIPQGGTGDIQVCLDNDIELTAFELYVSLPDGISMTGWQADKSRLTDHLVHVTNDSNELMATALSADNTAIAGNSGALMTITLKADESLAPGTVLTATLHDMVFSTYDMVEVNPATATFNITIGEATENRIVLSEYDTSLPTEAMSADVKVVRTIYADEWSTIVLPFDMNEYQLKEAFGQDVQLADFVSWNSEENAQGEIININVMFERVNELAANHPYIIKLPMDITEFKVDNVDIHAAVEPTVQVGQKKAERGKFIGTYTKDTVVPEENLFISGNKFWYSVGKTMMMGYRAYFELADVLDSYYNKGNANIMICLDESNGIAECETQAPDNMEGVYDLGGRKVAADASTRVAKGIYIINGKKIAQ